MTPGLKLLWSLAGPRLKTLATLVSETLYLAIWRAYSNAYCTETQYGASDSWQSFVDENGKRSDSSAFIREKDQQGRVCWDKPKEQCDPKARLHIWTYKFVTKILMDDKKRAFGVEYVNSDEVTASSR